MTTTEPATRPQDAAGAIAGKLSTLDRFLPVWILVAMGLGLGLGRVIPGLNAALAKVAAGGISLPIAVGLLVMMYPVLAKTSPPSASGCANSELLTAGSTSTTV